MADGPVPLRGVPGVPREDPELGLVRVRRRHPELGAARDRTGRVGRGVRRPAGRCRVVGRVLGAGRVRRRRTGREVRLDAPAEAGRGHAGDGPAVRGRHGGLRDGGCRERADREHHAGQRGERATTNEQEVPPSGKSANSGPWPRRTGVTKQRVHSRFGPRAARASDPPPDNAVDRARAPGCTVPMTTERWTSATVYPDMWADPDDDPREALANPVGEKETLLELSQALPDHAGDEVRRARRRAAGAAVRAAVDHVAAGAGAAPRTRRAELVPARAAGSAGPAQAVRQDGGEP